MRRKKQINVAPDQVRDFWNKSVQGVAEQLSIMEPETTKKPASRKKEKEVFQREVIAPEEALEQFVGSLCFAEYLFKAYDQEMILELHPYRKPSGWLWDCLTEPNQSLSYKVIILDLPRISEAFYEKVWQKYYSEEYSLVRVYCEIGNAYKGASCLEPYAEDLRQQLKGQVVEQSA